MGNLMMIWGFLFSISKTPFLPLWNFKNTNYREAICFRKLEKDHEENYFDKSSEMESFLKVCMSASQAQQYQHIVFCSLSFGPENEGMSLDVNKKISF